MRFTAKAFSAGVRRLFDPGDLAALQAPFPTQDGLTEVDLKTGGPQLCESPCQTIRRIPRTHEYYEYSSINFCGRRSIYSPERTPIVILLMHANRPDVNQRCRANIARKLQNPLRGQGLPEISVEFLDPGFEEDLTVHGCHPNGAVVPMKELRRPARKANLVFPVMKLNGRRHRRFSRSWTKTGIRRRHLSKTASRFKNL